MIPYCCRESGYAGSARLSLLRSVPWSATSTVLPRLRTWLPISGSIPLLMTAATPTGAAASAVTDAKTCGLS